MEKRYYLAYGSNLNAEQMRARCPGAVPVGTGELEGWSLAFRGQGMRVFLTIDKDPEGKVPVAVWAVTDWDEEALDLYEASPTLYDKQEVRLRYKDLRTGARKATKAFVYVMRGGEPLGEPNGFYLWICRQGYKDFGLDEKALTEALNKSREVCKDER